MSLLCPLNRASIPILPATIFRNTYDRTKLKTGIVHFGVGAFHRSHQATYLDHVLGKSDTTDWGICGIGLLPYDLPMRDAMRVQDCLYTVNEMSPEGKCRSLLVQAMIEYIYAPDDYEAVTRKLVDPAVKIVSLTITEGGYYMDNRGEFVVDHPHIVQDLANPTSPRSAVGYIVEGLARRRQAGLPAYTIMSCDNLRGNGHQAKKACLTYAAARDPNLAEWIKNNVSFPNAMVDRITPATDSTTRERLAALTGVDDRAPVICEDFIQWVLEDDFTNGRPPYEIAGVTITKNVLPYEEAKIRLLNGSHQMMSYPCFLAGYRRVDDAIKDPLFAEYIRGFLFEDAGPYIEEIPGVDMDTYKYTLIHRFGNETIGDQLARLCLDGGSKIPGFLLPTLQANLKEKGICPRIAFLLACYYHYIRNSKDDKGFPYDLREPNAMPLLSPIITSTSPLRLVECVELVGDAASFPQFVKDYLLCYDHIQKDGVYKTLENLATILKS